MQSGANENVEAFFEERSSNTRGHTVHPERHHSDRFFGAGRFDEGDRATTTETSNESFSQIGCSTPPSGDLGPVQQPQSRA